MVFQKIITIYPKSERQGTFLSRPLSLHTGHSSSITGVLKGLNKKLKVALAHYDLLIRHESDLARTYGRSYRIGKTLQSVVILVLKQVW